VHVLYLVKEFLGEIRGVTTTRRALGGDPLLPYDEWCCAVDCERGVANVRLSWNMRPLQNMLLLHGTAGTLRIDLFHMFIALRRQRGLPQAALRIINTVSDSARPLFEMPMNTVRFLAKRRRQYQGIHGFIQDFYGRLARGEAPAVTLEDGISVVRWTEFVAREAEGAYVSWNQRNPCSPACDVLVTGGAGKLGRVIVAELARAGRRVRVLSRRPPAGPLASGVEYFVGDLGDPLAVDAAVAGAATVIHAGAAMSGDADRNRGGTVIGTQNVLTAVERHECGKLVHISSLSVVDWAGSDRGGPVNEDAADEPHADLRGLYTRSKLDAEKLVRAAAASGKVNAIILRPGQIWGGDQPLMTAAVARRAGPVNLMLGNGQLRLPLVHVEDVVRAVLESISASAPSGTIIQLVSPSRFTQNDVLRICKPGGLTLRLPRPLVFGLGWLSERMLGWVGRTSPFGVYRLRSALARICFESDRAQRVLGWTVQVDERQAMANEALRGRAP
jgi:nucleoside-diphosphate-sugar epimerase